MNPITALFRFFENWIDPLRRTDRLRPPGTIAAYFWHYIRQAKMPLALSVLLGGLSSMLEALFFFYIGRLVDILDSSLFSQGWAGLIDTHGGELLTMFLVVFVFRIALVLLEGLLNEQVIDRGFYNIILWQSYAYVAQQSLSFFTDQSSGSVVSKVSQSGNAVGTFVTSLTQMLWTILVFAATTLILFAQLDARLALIIIVGIGIFAVIAYHFLPRLRAQAAQNAEASAALNGRVVDSFSNIQTLKLFGQSDTNDDYVRQGFQRFLDARLRMGRLSIGMRTSMTILTASMVVGVAVISIELWSQELISVGAVAFAMALVMRLNMLFGRLMGGLNHLMRNFGIVQNAMETISLPISVTDAPDAKPFEPGDGQIEIYNVTFNYDRRTKGDSGTIKNMTLSIKSGEKVGIVGRSGAGKTTLINLLLRFYDVQQGQISIDGQDVAKVTQDSLRRSIGVVTQDTAMLHRSVRANIGFGRDNATDEDIVDAAKRAEAHDFIVDLKDPSGRTGYSAYVGERGIKLSGGQRQRIAIARVLLKNAPILVLDEATSALDSEVEAAIQSQFDRLVEGKTVIAIAHRLSTIAAMDRLIVIDKGEIVEQGTHQQLLENGQLYATLWNRQSGGFIASDEEIDTH